ncbi:helix-turn-helix transcriptional regulator [Gordonia aichiensis]|uniref:Putative AraC family transcriptional regulator n=1 Tax=Gordonia aichiensis NBRC 108223 TaxID=1220583 RepID=L7KHU3_9ACTN|nr:AraC family transcriptional regulator [Gordonia aichiensis]GAC47502.1 putative AraC family transcriptional regulator [Gordonia aichiensis NBRC 108223]
MVTASTLIETGPGVPETDYGGRAPGAVGAAVRAAVPGQQGRGTVQPEFWHDPRFLEVESRRSCRENSCYRLHTHDRFAIGIIDEGTSEFVGRSATPVMLEAGDVVLIPAGHLHRCNPVGGRWVYQMMLLDEDWLRTRIWPRDASFDGTIQVHRDGDARRLFSDANGLLYDAPDDLSAFRRLLCRAFSRLTTPELLEPRPSAMIATDLQPVLEVLAEQVEDPRLDDLAGLVGMNRFQLIRAVRSATGLTPIAWRNNARVVRARAMLRGGEPIASVAHALGFSDQSHLHRVFRQYVAATPGSYRG